MRTIATTSIATVCIASFLAAASTLTATAGELHLLGLVPFSYADDVSDDGQVVVGYDRQSYWYWTPSSGVVQLIGTTIPPGSGVGGQGCITADGRFMTCSTLQGTPQKAEATIYDIQNLQYTSIGSFGYNCDLERTGAWGMSNDGKHIVGLGWQIGCAARGFAWDEGATALTDLGTLYFYKPTRANDISDDGRVIAGWNDDYNGWRQAAAWIKNAQGVFVQTNITAPPPPGSTVPIKMSEADVVSGDGHWVYGIGRSTFASGTAWRWSPATGVQAIGSNPTAGQDGYVVDANYDGSKVLCFYGVMGGGGSFLWTAERGYVSLSQIANEAGVTIPDGWVLNLPLGMSEDALTIVGTASGPNGTSPFVLDLRPTPQFCTADLNADGSVSAPDLTIVLSQWGAAAGSADLNGDGVVGPQDITVLLSQWGPCL
jgi:uncharacterized membrane protein